MEASIIIPTVGRAELLNEVLCCLQAQPGNFEIIVISDGEHAAIRELAANCSFPRSVKWLFSSENRGQAAARNLGAQHAAGEVLLFLDDDTLPGSEWVNWHMRHHAAGKDTIVIGSLEHIYRVPARDRTEQFFRESSDHLESALRLSLAVGGSAADAHLWVGLNTSLPRLLFLSTGGFDECLRYVQEDAELANRIRARGVSFIYEPHALVQHVSTKSLAQVHFSRAALFAATDLYRLRQKKQPMVRWPMLGALFDHCGPHWLKQRLSWHLPGLANFLARIFGAAGQITGMHFCLRQWRDLRFSVAYWNEVKTQGVTLSGLRELLG